MILLELSSGSKAVFTSITDLNDAVDLKSLLDSKGISAITEISIKDSVIALNQGAVASAATEDLLEMSVVGVARTEDGTCEMTLYQIMDEVKLADEESKR